MSSDGRLNYDWVETCQVQSVTAFQGKVSGGKLRIIYFVAAASVILGLGSYGYHLYLLFRDLQTNKSQPQVKRLTRDLRQFNAETHRFPANFIEINGRLWHTKPPPDYGSDGWRAWTRNYYYFYTKINDETSALWVFPVGPQRQYASSFFVVLSPDWMRAWKGEAMSDEEIARIPAIPPPTILAELKMKEAPPCVFNASQSMRIQLFGVSPRIDLSILFMSEFCSNCKEENSHFFA